MEKILTISIASYNVEKYIAETLDSLVQSPAIDDLEILVVNDGSKDRTVEIVKGYEEKYPQSVKLIDKPNGGWGSTINASLQVATGKYFKLLDGDDWFETKNIEPFIEFLKKAEEDVVFTQYTKVYEPKMDRELEVCTLPELQTLSISTIDAIAMHSVCVKTSVIQGKIQITEHCFYTDSEFAVKVLYNAETAIYLPISVYDYRLGLGGQSVAPASMGRNFAQHEKIFKTVCPLVFSSEKLTSYRDSMRRMANTQYTFFLCAPVNRDTYKKIRDFSKYVKKEFKSVYKGQRLAKRMLGASYLFYYIVAKRVHKKNNLA